MSGFVAFVDAWGADRVAPFAGQCRALVMDPRRGRPAAGALEHPDRAGRAAFEQVIRALAPDLGVICSYSRILWPDLLALFRFGVVNLHGGRLPAYRGANTLQWAIINGETETAATLHYVDAGIDTGPVIAAGRVPIGGDDTALDVRDRLAGAADAILAEWLPRLLDGKVPATPQDEAGARTWPRRHPEDGLIDWRRSDREIRDLIRALAAPWPGARYLDRQGKVQIIDTPMSLAEIARLRQAVTAP